MQFKNYEIAFTIEGTEIVTSELDDDGEVVGDDWEMEFEDGEIVDGDALKEHILLNLDGDDLLHHPDTTIDIELIDTTIE